MHIPTGASTTLMGDGPQLRVLGQALSTNSASVPSYLSFTIPSQAQTGDYLVLFANNFVSRDATSTSDGWVFQYGTLGQGTYPVGCTTVFKVCQAGDANKTLNVLAGTSAFGAMMYVFTNPNQTDVATVTSYYTMATLWAFQDYNPYETPSTANTTSLVVPPTHNGSLYPPGALKFTGWAGFGTSSLISHSYSGPGTFRTIGDSSWSMATSAAYEVNSTNALSAGTVSQSQSGAMTAQSMYLI